MAVTAQRWVHRQKSTGKFAVVRRGYAVYNADLQGAKVYRTRNGGSGYLKNMAPEDFEWVRVELTIVETPHGDA